MISVFAMFNAIRRPESALRFMALVNSLFFASFLAVLLFASSQADAQEIVCTGENMVEALQKSDPAAYAKLEAEAAATPNSSSRLWKIEKDGVKPSYLFGTMHMTDPRVIDLTPEARTAFDSVGTVVIESTDILDEKTAAKALLSNPGLTMFTDATTLTSLLSKEDAEKLNKGLTARGMPLITVNKMRPWLISSMIVLPACEMQRKKGGAPFLDIKLAQDAEAAGKKVEGLETIVEQIDAMNAVSMDLHIRSLVEVVALGDKMDDVMETMIALYAEGRTGLIMPFMKGLKAEGLSSISDEAYGDFEEIMLTARNKVMSARAAKILAEGNAFIAVGALHLPGEKGLVELFRKEGYVLTALAK
jgi:uncharacterized protein YbaP (TraB family)